MLEAALFALFHTLAPFLAAAVSGVLASIQAMFVADNASSIIASLAGKAIGFGLRAFIDLFRMSPVDDRDRPVARKRAM